MTNRHDHIILDLENLSFPDLRFALNYWREKKGDRAFPSWADISLIDFPPAVVPRVCIVDVLDGPDFSYRFWGTALSTLHKSDLTGRCISELAPPTYRASMMQQYLEIVQGKTPRAFLNKIPTATGHGSYYANIRLPLSSDGRTIDMILSVEDYADQHDDLVKSFNHPLET